MPKDGKNYENINLDEVDNPLTVLNRINFVGAIFVSVIDGFFFNGKTMTKEYVTKNGKKYSFKILRWIQWNMFLPSSQEVALKINSRLIKSIVGVATEVLLKYIAEDQKDEIAKLLKTVWEKNYEKILLEAYKEERDAANLKEKIAEINKLCKRNSEGIYNFNRTETETIVKDIIKILKSLKTNKLAQKIVKEHEEISKVVVYDRAETITPCKNYFLKKEKFFLTNCWH